ncbi:hypothetical protein [Dyadobacter sp. CY326]|uniref:hypothetical protein n=1 Tax=Dyadobacter sp. CY326 TaxID=2907300 RepID=UPI001F2A0C40|nr:hypothetical protein [Dyadobacter sp. CY326]MCE7065809.1 hypothetical protein [Dyadobacter sp. CY326]
MDKTVFILYRGDDDQQTPIAAFSELEVIETLIAKLNRFIEGGADLKTIPLQHCKLEVDKYADLVKSGKTPYYISLHRDGGLFDPWDLLSDNLDEPTPESYFDHIIAMRDAETINPDKQWGVGGTFWVDDPKQAIKKANDLRKVLFKKFKVPLTRDRH